MGELQMEFDLNGDAGRLVHLAIEFGEASAALGAYFQKRGEPEKTARVYALGRDVIARWYCIIEGSEEINSTVKQTVQNMIGGLDAQAATVEYMSERQIGK